MENKKQIKSSATAGGNTKAKLGTGSEFLGRFRRSAKADKKSSFSSVIIGIMYGAAAFFFGSCDIAFSAYPFGIALLCAADSKIGYILLGLLGAACTADVNTTVYLIAFSFILIVRVLSRMLVDKPEISEHDTEELGEYGVLRYFFSESVYLRTATAGIGAFSVSLYSIIAGGFRYYDLFGAILAMVVSPLATFVYCGAFSWRSADFSERTRRFMLEIAVLGLLATGVFSLRELSLLGISCPVFVAFFSTLYICNRFGFARGVATGALLGLCVSPRLAPVFILGAVASSGLSVLSTFVSGIAACIVGTVWGIYVDGIYALTALFPALLISSMVCAALEKLTPAAVRGKEQPASEAAAENAVAGERLRANEEKISAISGAFSSLAEVMFTLSNRLKKPAAGDLRQMCDSAYDKFCPGCEMCDVCWGEEYSKSIDMINKITTGLQKKGLTDEGLIPDYMKERCKYLPEIVSAINRGCASLSEQAMNSEKTEVFAVDYEALSQILTDALEENKDEYGKDSVLSEKVAGCIEKNRIKCSSVIVFGDRKKQISINGLPMSETDESMARLMSDIEKACSLSLAEPEYKVDGDKVNAIFTNRRTVSVKYAYATCSADGRKENCGDTVSLFENGSDYFYSLLCDGMGVGREAAFNSSICSMFMQKMLNAGNRSETTMRMLNSFMRSKGKGSHECSATIDLMELDLLHGRAAFIKSGAASSYVIRNKNIFRVQSKTIPIGIVKALDAERIRFDTEDGDIILMMSDGITGSETDVDWLYDVIEHGWEDDLEIMSKKILARAKEQGGEDDRSVILLEIGKNK